MGMRFAAFAMVLVLSLGLVCAGNASLEISFSSNNVILKPGSDSTDITVTVTGADGTPAKGVWVFITLSDPKNTGILGPLGHADIVKYADTDGKVHGTVKFPPESECSSKNFPTDIIVTAYSARHDFSEEWFINGTASIKVDTPSPRVVSASINPNPAQPNSTHTFHLEITDVDSNTFTYPLHTDYGAWGAVTATGKTLNVNWVSPSRNYNSSEIELAKSMGYGLQSMAYDLSSAGSESDASKIRSIGSSSFGFVSDLFLFSDTQKSISLLTPELLNSATKRNAYNNIGLGFDKGKVTVGFLHFQAGRSAILSGLANGGLADAFAGSLSARVADTSSKRSIRSSRDILQPYFFEVLVQDESGNNDTAVYPFVMESEGFNK